MQHSGLLNLPVDLLWQVARYLDSVCLVKLGATCKGLRSFTDGILARRHGILFIDTSRDASVTDKSDASFARLVPQSMSPAEDIQALFLSLCQSKKLATYTTKVAVLECFSRLQTPCYLQTEWSTVQKALSGVVEPNPLFFGTVYESLRKGHSAAFSFCTLFLLRSVKEIAWFSTKFKITRLLSLVRFLPGRRQPFRSLEFLSIRMDSAVDLENHRITHADNIWPLMMAPSVRCLQVIGLTQAVHGFQGPVHQSRNLAYTRVEGGGTRLDFSNGEPPQLCRVEVLRFRYCYLSTTYLQYLLRSNPKLQAFEYITIYDPDMNQLTLDAFEYAMQPCLSQLKIFDWDIQKASELELTELAHVALSHRAGSFRNFSNLQRLGLPWYFVMGNCTHDAGHPEDLFGHACPPPVEDALPPSLKVLVLRHCEYETENLVLSLLIMQEAIAIGKLKGLSQIRLQAYQDAIVLQGLFDEVIAACKANGIDFRIDEEYQPPKLKAGEPFEPMK